MVLSQGVASRHLGKVAPEQQFQQGYTSLTRIDEEARQFEFEQAMNFLGVEWFSCRDFPDQQFDQVSLLKMVKEIEEVKEWVKPDIVYTHCQGDLNLDHTLTYRAVITAFRPKSDNTAKQIYSFEVLPWLRFNPTVFTPIEIGEKLEALNCYSSELRQFPHPRSPEGIIALAQYRGMSVGLQYAEAFEMVRWVK